MNRKMVRIRASRLTDGLGVDMDAAIAPVLFLSAALLLLAAIWSTIYKDRRWKRQWRKEILELEARRLQALDTAIDGWLRCWNCQHLKNKRDDKK